jgi:hypothetical protein
MVANWPRIIHGNLPTIVKFHPFQPLLLVAALTVSCGGDFHPEGKYRGRIVMGDGNKLIRLDLLANEKASLGGLLPKTLQGTWKKEATGVGFAKDGVMATFDTKKSSGEKFRLVLMLRQAEGGLTLADIRARLLLEDKFSMLQSFKLKEENPLLRRVKFK